MPFAPSKSKRVDSTSSSERFTRKPPNTETIHPTRKESPRNVSYEEKSHAIQEPSSRRDIFDAKKRTENVTREGIPVIKKQNSDNKVVSVKKIDESPREQKVFPDMNLERKENIFPEFPEKQWNS